MGSIFDTAKVTYASGPAVEPKEPDKAEIIKLFQLVEAIIGTAIEGLIIGNAVVYATRSALYADLAHPAGRLGIVYGDSTAALNGVYVKSGASGAGGWAITSLVLPSSFITDLSGVIAEVANARQGRGNLLANIAAINRRAPSILASVGGTANAITGSDPLSSADESNDPATSYILIPAATNTAAATLSVNGDTARPIRTFANAEVAAGDLVAGSYYLLISDGGRYRVFSGLGAAPVKPSDLDLKANQAAFLALLEEVTAARNGRGSLDARLDTLDEAVATKASQSGLDSVSSEVASARQGRGNLLLNVASISRRAPSVLADVAGSANAITATDALSTADEANDPGTSYILVPSVTNTDAVTLAVNGDTARPIRTLSNNGMVAGDLVAGYYYLLIAAGTHYRVYSQLGARAVRQSDVDSKASQTALQAVLDEIVAARGGRGNLDARLDTLDETVEGKASQTALDTALAGKLDKTMPTSRVLGRATASTGDVENLTVTRGLSLSAGSIGMDDMPQATFKGRAAGGGAGTPSDLTAAQAKTALALDQVSNTSDADKPVSTAQAAAVGAVAARAATLETIAAPEIHQFGTRPVLQDWEGLLGQVRTLYFMRTFFYRTIEGTASQTLAPESTRLPGYVELQIPTVSNYKVFIHRPTGVLSAYLQSALPPLSKDNQFLFDVSGGGAVGNSAYTIENIENEVGAYYPRAPFAIETNGDIFIPGHSWNSRYYNTAAAPPSGFAWYKKLSGFATASMSQTLCFNQILAAQGLDGYTVVDTPSFPKSRFIRPLISRFNSAAPYVPHGVPLIGAVPGGSAPNEANLGKNAVEAATYFSANSVPCDITNATMIALGFTRGVNNPATQTPKYGVTLKDNTPRRWVFLRLYVVLPDDGAWPQIQAFWVNAAGAASGAFILSKEEDAINGDPRVAVYSAWRQIPDDGVTYAKMGTGIQTGGAGRDIKIAGLQLASGMPSPLWIMRSDYPPATSVTLSAAWQQSKGKIVYPSEMFLVEDEELRFYPAGALDELPSDGFDIVATVEARSLLPSGKYPLPEIGKAEVRLTGGKVAPSSVISMRSIRTGPDKRFVRPVAVRTASKAALAGLSADVMFLGDSLVQYSGLIQATVRSAAANGFTINPIGTVDCQEHDLVSGGMNLMKGEGRGARDFGNYTYETGTGSAVPCEPFPDSFIPTYLALPTGNKLAYNPFLRPALDGDPPQRVFNGYIFDPEWMRNRPWGFTIPIPKHVALELGTNDEVHNGGLPAANGIVNRGLETIIGQIRAAWPETYVHIVANPLPRNSLTDLRWMDHMILYKLFQTYVTAQNSRYVTLINAAAHANSEVAWDPILDSTDELTGSQSYTATADLHFKWSAKQQVGQAVWSAIACRHLGL